MLITSIARLQDLYIERVREWTRFMAPAGWARLSRWQARDWMKLIWQALVAHTKHKPSRLLSLREERLGKYKDPTFTTALVTARHAGTRRARIRLGQILWQIYYEECHTEIKQLQQDLDDRSSPILSWQWKGVENNVDRLQHAMRCLIQYVRMVYRPSRVAKHTQEVRTRKAKWNICAYLVRTHKQAQHEKTLAERVTLRAGKICAHTRNVQRLTPKGITSYDETRRHRPHIKQHETYKTNRWPRRDKIGPTLVHLLHKIWEIT